MPPGLGANRQGLAALIGSAVAIFWPGALAFGLPGVLIPHWQQSLGVGRGALGSFMYVLLMALGCFMYLTGRWQLKLGARKIMALGALALGLSQVMAVYIDSLASLYVWAFVSGVGQCLVYIPALSTVQRWFPERRGLVSGLVNLVFGGAAAPMSPLFAAWLPSLGYAGLNLAVGGVTVVVGLAAAWFCEFPPGPAAGPAGGPKSLTVSQTLRLGVFWRLWGVVALVGAAGVSMVTLAAAYGQSLGLGLSQAVWILAGFNLGSGLSRLMMGWLSDVIERGLAMSLAFALAAGAYLTLPWVAQPWLAVCLAALVGGAFGTLFAVSGPLAGDCFGPKHFGEIFGLLFTAYGFVAGGMGPSLAGYLLDYSGGSFLPVFSYLGLLCLAAAFLVRGVRPPQEEKAL